MTEKLERNLAYYAKNEDGDMVETGIRPTNIPYPIADVMFDNEGNALNGSSMIAAGAPWPIDIQMTEYLRDIIDNHPKVRAIRPLIANVTYRVDANPYPDDAGYSPFYEGHLGRKSIHEVYGGVVEYGTRPDSISEPVVGNVFDVFGNVLDAGSSANPIPIDKAATARLRKYFKSIKEA